MVILIIVGSILTLLKVGIVITIVLAEIEVLL
jgi:hypothetical protein